MLKREVVMLDFPQLAREFNAAVLSDVLDELGLRQQAMKPFVRPLDETLVVMGRARTGRFVLDAEIREGENPYEIEMALMDDLKPGDVPVLACGGPTDVIAPWGELLTTACIARGASGCVTDGLVRDVRQIRELRFPVFHGGIGPLDTKGRARMVEMDGEVVCGGVPVRSGDIVFADVDGVVILPYEQAVEAVGLARAKAAREDGTRDALRQGRLLREVYAEFGVL